MVAYLDDVPVRIPCQSRGTDGEVELLVYGEVEPGEPGNYTGHPDSRHPAEPDRADYDRGAYLLQSYTHPQQPWIRDIWEAMDRHADRIIAAILEAYRQSLRDA